MSVGDIAAALIGQTFGRTKIGNKTIEGSLGCLVVCALTAYGMNILPLSVSLFGAFMATIFEALPIEIDDNILIPLGSGTAMLIMSTLI